MYTNYYYFRLLLIKVTFDSVSLKKSMISITQVTINTTSNLVYNDIYSECDNKMMTTKYLHSHDED